LAVCLRNFYFVQTTIIIIIFFLLKRNTLENIKDFLEFFSVCHLEWRSINQFSAALVVFLLFNDVLAGTFFLVIWWVLIWWQGFKTLVGKSTHIWSENVPKIRAHNLKIQKIACKSTVWGYEPWILEHFRPNVDRVSYQSLARITSFPTK
jgi:hypothetical protein